MQAAHYWKDNIADLRIRAAIVTMVDGAPASSTKMSARTAAAVLSGICGLVSRRWTVDQMQRTCAELVRYEPAWASSFGRLPAVHGAAPTEPTQLIAVVARSLLPLSGDANLRAALAFWASEDDPAAWSQLTPT